MLSEISYLCYLFFLDSERNRQHLCVTKLKVYRLDDESRGL